MTTEDKRAIAGVLTQELNLMVAHVVWAAIEVAERHWDAQDTNNYGTKAEAVIKERD